MAVKSVNFNGQRINDSDSNSGWGNYNVGGGAPASESANAYQVTTGSASTVGVVGKKVNSTVSRQGVDYFGQIVNYTASTNRLFYCKVYVTDSFDLNPTYGVEVSIGTNNTADYYSYNLAGSSALLPVYESYPPQGGYIITAIDPTIAQWAIGTNGTFDPANARWYALGAQFQNGFAKAENVSFDALDYGIGLTLTGGTAGDPHGNFIDYRLTDQDVRNNRWGVVTGSGNSITARGMLRIGTITGTSGVGFTDNNAIVTFPDGYHSAGLFGVLALNNNAACDITINSTLIGNGSRNGNAILDTRPDFTVQGTLGSFNSAANLRNFRNITYTSSCDIDGADIQCELLTQGGANITNTTIRTNAQPGVACLQDPTFGSTTGLNNCTFTQTSGSTGQAIEISAAGSYDLTGLKFSGYGANGSANSAINVTATTGTVTLNILGGGDTPTHRTAGATVIKNNSVNVSVEAIDVAGNPISGARVYLVAAAGGSLPAGTVIISGLTDAQGMIDTGFSFSGNQPVTGVVRKSTSSPLYREAKIIGSITANGFSSTVAMVLDE